MTRFEVPVNRIWTLSDAELRRLAAIGPWFTEDGRCLRRSRRRKALVGIALFSFGVACGWLGSLVYEAWTLWHMAIR